MRHALAIAACVICASVTTAHAQQTGTYTTYIAGKAAIVEQWTATTEEGILKDSSKPSANLGVDQSSCEG
jgi:hypothetical protein